MEITYMADDNTTRNNVGRVMEEPAESVVRMVGVVVKMLEMVMICVVPGYGGGDVRVMVMTCGEWWWLCV